ncbi:DNA/RNA non-specific endonuclease [uncultured Pseudoalteromonas sp.]|uniref:DNA/RNA non-specific endonuclease n=2 Tax=Pseudoalteromonas TaxID=53246 RepID=UPI00259249BA|nr:DNA/RNA non-specific endonuclease [uncultured Pseudoalteromonas sp.]
MKTIIKASIVLTGLCFAHSASADNCLQGCPTGLDNGNTIERSIYTLKNNRYTKFADWVAYHVTTSTMSGPSRSRSWKADPDLYSLYKGRACLSGLNLFELGAIKSRHEFCNLVG